MEDDYDYGYDYDYDTDYYQGPPAKPNRRSFLGAALATVAAAAVTGGTAALLLKDDGPPAITADSPPTMQSTATAAPGAGNADASYLQAQLTALEAENNDLKNNLSAAQRQLASYTGTSNDGSGDQEWQQQYEQASAQATELGGRLTVVQGLLALYEELEALDLDTVAAEGVAVVGGALEDLVAEVPLVSQGLAAGRQAIDELEAQLPLVEQGRYWLEGQMALVGRALKTAEGALSNVLKAGDSFVQLLDRWFEDILKWLPFGIGENALAIMSALGDLLASVPETLDGLRANVADPLDVWLERDGDENRLQRRLIKPVREEALQRADSTVSRLGDVHDAYQLHLGQPVTALAERQHMIREQIAQYRQSHSL